MRTIQSLDETQMQTAVVGGLALVVLFGGLRFAPRVPWGLVMLVLGVIASRAFDLEAEGVAMIGEVPSGLPPLGLPFIPRDDVGAVLVGGMSLGLVALAEGLAATRLFATRGGYRVETNRELVGMGAANVAAGLSGGLAVDGEPVEDGHCRPGREQKSDHRAHSGCIHHGRARCVHLGVHRSPPGGAERDRRRRGVGPDRRVGTASLPPGPQGRLPRGRGRRRGRRAVRAPARARHRDRDLTAGDRVPVLDDRDMEVLGKIDGEKAAWGRLHHHPDRRPVDGVVVVRLDAPLFWANASAFEDRLLDQLDEWPGTRALVLDLEATTQLDTTSADMLAHLAAELDSARPSLPRTGAPWRQRGVARGRGFGETVGPDRFWHSISQCVRAARRDTGLGKTNGAGRPSLTRWRWRGGGGAGDRVGREQTPSTARSHPRTET